MTRPFVLALALASALLAPAAAAQAKKRPLPKPGFNLFSKEQDIEIGREFARQVEQQMVVVQNRELTAYINRVGQRLVERGGLEKYPFYFKVVQEDSINAFALPGGPMYVHTGLIRAVENEAQLAGVLAHELAHVVLRHGTSQATKAQFTQLAAILAGSMIGGGGLTGQLAQLGIGLGANSVLLKYSRSAESDADLLGAYTMARAGYNPIEMARFFEKLEAEREGKTPRLVEIFTASHPNPGNRVKAIEEQLPFMPRGDYNAQEGDLGRMKAIVEKLPAVKKPEQGSAAPAALPRAPKPERVSVSQRMQSWRGDGFRLDHPDNWRVTRSEGGVTIAPPEGVVQGFVGYGVLIRRERMPNRLVSLERDTQALIDAMIKRESNMRVLDPPQRVVVGGRRGLVTRLSSDSPFADLREIDVLVTADLETELFYMVCVAPLPDYPSLEPVFQQMVRSISFE
ncbi:MAG: M48 family metallopeptidase [Bryobacteraceae bacterium]|nr:M48 family metallopeptidase [Bryobacteraceae bacterium]